ALVGATIISVWQATRAVEAQRQAEADRDRAGTAQIRAEAAERRVVTEAAIATAVNNFLQRDLLLQVDVVTQHDEGFSADPNLSVKEALNRAATRIGDRFQTQPLVEAAIRTVIANAYMSMGEDYSAVNHRERAFALRQVHLGPDHPDTLAAMDQL